MIDATRGLTPAPAPWGAELKRADGWSHNHSRILCYCPWSGKNRRGNLVSNGEMPEVAKGVHLRSITPRFGLAWTIANLCLNFTAPLCPPYARQLLNTKREVRRTLNQANDHKGLARRHSPPRPHPLASSPAGTKSFTRSVFAGSKRRLPPPRAELKAAGGFFPTLTH